MTESDYWAAVLGGGPDAETVVREFFEGEGPDADVAGWIDECEALATQEGINLSGVVQEWRDRAILSIREKLFEMS